MTRYQLDARGLPLEQENALGDRVRYQYDSQGRLIELQNENRARYHFSWDALGRLVAEQGFDGRRQHYRYDAAGYLVEALDGVGSEERSANTPETHSQPIRTRFQRDMLGRLLGKYSFKSQPGQRPLIQRDRYQYDAAGQLITARNAHARVVLHHDAMGNLLEEQLYQRGRGLSQLRHEYDELGNRLRTHLPDGRQLDTLRYGSGHVFAMELDGASLCDMERDSLHREISRSQGALRSRYQWDAMGRLLTSRAEQQQQSQQQPLVGEPNSQGQQIARSYQYDAAGQLTAISDTRKGLTRYGYDELGRLLSAAHPFAVNEVFAFDPAHNLISQQQAEHNQQKRQTDNRWSEEEWQAYVKANAHRADFDPWLTPEQVENDPRFWGEARPNRLSTWQDHRYQYDDFGNCIEKISGSINNSTQQKLEWDVEHRLSKVWIERTHNGKTTREGWGYDYDPFGRRLAKYPLDAAENKQKLQQQFSPWKSPKATYYGWDGHQLISEQQQNKHQLYIYEPDSFVPLALIKSEGQLSHVSELEHALQEYPLEWQQLQQQYPEQWADVLAQQSKYRRQAGVAELTAKPNAPSNQRVFYYHTDHLGTPQELTDTAGNIVWSAQYKAWGQVHTIVQPQICTQVHYGGTLTERWIEPEQIEQPLRFQGQYHDNETGLHYNRYRYYDPDIGRFISQDPVGLLGGINLYQYAPNPVGWVDPFGLCPDKITKGTDSKLSRNGAYQEAKEKAGIPRSQQPDKVYKERIRDQEGYVQGRVYEFQRQDGGITTIKEHSLGHREGNHGPHFNSEVRSSRGNKQPLSGNGDSHTYFKR